MLAEETKTVDPNSDCETLRQKLAASELREKNYREAYRSVKNWMPDWARDRIRKVLAQSTDTSTLDELVSGYELKLTAANKERDELMETLKVYLDEKDAYDRIDSPSGSRYDRVQTARMNLDAAIAKLKGAKG